MTFSFTKMHGLGNDFAIIDTRMLDFDSHPGQIRMLANRQRGIGFDQLLTIEHSRNPQALYYYGIWNADGEPVGQCGNGVRCVAAWLYRQGLLPQGKEVLLESPSGLVSVEAVDAQTVTVNMGEPSFALQTIPFNAPKQANTYALEIDGNTLSISALSMGNPHAITLVSDPYTRQVDQWGPQITAHKRFPESCNAGFAHIENRRAINLRVHERGSGWTQACGTGACAAMAALHQQGLVDDNVQVTLPGGPLTIHWQGPGFNLWMTGPATFVFEGQWLNYQKD